MAEENQNPEENEAENTEGEGAEGEEGEGGKSGGKSPLLFIIIAVVLVAAAGGGAFFFISSKPKPEDTAELEDTGPVDPFAQLDEIAFFSVPEIVANLTTDGKQKHFIKLKASVEIARESEIPMVEKALPRLQDDFNVYLRQLRMEDLQGSSGIHRLKEGLVLRAKQSLAPIEVNNVLINDVLVQ